MLNETNFYLTDEHHCTQGKEEPPWSHWPIVDSFEDNRRILRFQALP